MLPGSGSRVRGFLLAAGIFAAGFVGHLSASSVSGVVVARQGDRLVPVFRASVAARDAARNDIVAVARTDREGRFLIVDLASPRVSLSAHKQGYFTGRVNGREDDSVVLDCSAAIDCAGIEFELGAAAVISGIVVDNLGEPLGELGVRVTPSESTVEARGRANSGSTDDRGYFRIGGLKPGRYTVTAEGRVRSFFREQAMESDAVEVEVAEGGEAGGIQLTARHSEVRREVYQVSGRVSGVDLSLAGTHAIHLRDLPGAGRRGPHGSSMARPIDKDGSFLLNGLDRGRYALAYIYNGRSNSGESVLQPLGTIEVSGDVSGLALAPLPPTGFSGAVQFETSKPARALRLSLISTDAEHFAWDRVEPPDSRFEFTTLTPGTYRLTISSGWLGNTGLYVKGIQRGEEFVPGSELVATEGVVERFDIVVSDELGRVYGRVKAATEPGAEQVIRKGAQFQVALAGPNELLRVTQADQFGRFEFEGVLPGEYRICGWADVPARAVHDEKTWEQAGSAVRKFTVEAGSDVELELTAAP